MTIARNDKCVHSLAISATKWLKQKKQYCFPGANDCSEVIHDAWAETDSS